MVDRDTLIEEAQDAGADTIFIQFLRVVDEESSAYTRMESLYNSDYQDVSDFPSSDFFSAIWAGDIEQAFEHRDVKNGEALEEILPDHPANPNNDL